MFGYRLTLFTVNWPTLKLGLGLGIPLVAADHFLWNHRVANKQTELWRTYITPLWK